MKTKVYVNRTLNLKRIKYLGFDMDHTLVRYHSREFEALSYRVILEKLVRDKGYPEEILSLPFDYNAVIRGLVMDRKRGNLLKVNRHGGIRGSRHGLKTVDFKSQQQLYKSTYIDLGDPNYYAVDTAFSVSHAAAFSQVIEYKNNHLDKKLPDYSIISDDVLYAINEAHTDDSLKKEVRSDVEKYIVSDPSIAEGLERYKKHGKKLFLLTNSDFQYTQILLDYAITPHLKEHKSVFEVLEFVITMAQKPRFFYDNLKFLKVNPLDGSLTNYHDKLAPGIYQGGCAAQFTRDFCLEGDDILYVGDHIYGDILRLKKDCNWRTAMVIEELDSEIERNLRAKPVNDEIEKLMKDKEPFEDEYTRLVTQKIEKKIKIDEGVLEKLQNKIGDIDREISQLIQKQQAIYNLEWGPLMRAGNEDSYFANQVERFACIYMTRLGDLFDLSPRTYFRAPHRPLVHEL